MAQKPTEKVEYKNLKRKRQDVPSASRKSAGAPATHNPYAAKKARLLEKRKELPIWNRQEDIVNSLKENRILVLSGETGSGKSTQFPQFLLSAPYLPRSGPGSAIAVTQPRRVAAITLAKRVADEHGSRVGGEVGYSVRFDDCTGKETRIKFLTEGMLLQEILRDETLGRYGVVVVDEVHERSVDVDLILGFLKGLVKRRKGLRVVVMSATANVQELKEYFAEDAASLENGDGGDAKDVATPSSKRNGDMEMDHSEVESNRSTKRTPAEQPTSHLGVSDCHVEGRQYPVKLHYLDTPTEDVVDMALQRIFQIHCKEPMPGDVLVFLTGQETIVGLQKLVEEFAEDLTNDFPKLLARPLYAALPQDQQQLVFEPAPPNTRKVILSTNIAETSVTVPGVKFVIDTGKAKIKQFRNKLGLESLLIKPISRSSADQRKGRAGRESPGQCYRLYTQKDYDSLEKDAKPEILRCDLSDAVLKMKARGIDDIISFSFLSPPPREALERSLLQLHQLGFLDDSGRINEDGRKASRLPLTPSLGRVLLEAVKRDCLLEVIDIVACLSTQEKSIFITADTEEGREKAAEARSQLIRRQGDHLTVLAAVQGYAAENADRKRWCRDHMISHRAMRSVMDVRKQLIAQCKQLAPNATMRSTVDEVTQESILKCFLRGYSKNVAHLCPDKSYKTFPPGSQTVAIHPSSVLFGRKVEAIMYNEFVFTNKAYARGVSAVQLRWLEELYE
ncbi:putative ATP-dependent RNA helicase prh1 [Fulvia fulva]|uniref:RNA helicase n=1 Tax=Passalora fulva TaxID=5499 RepID=A0A9Q8PJW0_PASFU|nr:putative ATP-dependent RNA helicase prh1 [Fulvia fulva]KAK4612256.1 putative ATP-dependent RNA helicase prh1 [Fulvia fulva]KAK4612460.1 putative ATP-dependent RNA helicase prh1 [Fulvia fulva]UJO23999.1 putative ATP-dependent RNA helicase prh1 [Fulvia fulva]WPV21490.1 putative ATP-dependent RNA helicase prh1 [Fulvia fulva]WPV36561.1 putative ATP-dependent RNA helicase prh1 [Fulvia fulva]